MTHDYDGQRQETFDTFAEAGPGLPRSAVVDFIFFVEETDADWAAFEKALRAKGFTTRRLDDDETLVASYGPMPVTPEAIWTQERLATEIALRHDFFPDGWDLDENA